MLAELVKQFHQLEEEIVLAISADNEETVYQLDRDLEITRRQIASLRPVDPWQRKQQVEFLLGLVVTSNEQLKETEAFRDVHRLIGEYLECQETSKRATREQLLSKQVGNVTGNPSELAAFLDGKLSRYKMPKRFIFWEALPKSAYGKITKKMIREKLERRGEVPPE